MFRQGPEGPKRISAFMRFQDWPSPENNPTIGIQLDYQTVPESDTTIADQVWLQGQVTYDRVPPQD
eukprot:7009808-Karenia_brevis.AAC.1